MCYSESCLGYMLIFIFLFFSFLIYFLLKFRKKILSSDLKISADGLWNDFSLSFPQKVFNQNELIFSIWQDKTAATSLLLIKNYLDEVVGEVEFPIGAREYRIFTGGQVYKIVVNLTWGGTNLSLFSPDEKELARLERRSFSPMKHRILISGTGCFTSKQPLFNLKAPIVYTMNKNILAGTCFISPTRRIGRMGCFGKEVNLPIKIFILSMTS